MQPQPRALSLAIGAALGIAFSIPAHALVITQTSAQRTDVNVIIAEDSSSGDGAVMSTTQSTATFGSYAQFSPDAGVLTGVTVSLGATGTFRQTNSGNAVGNTTLDASWSYFGQASSHQLAARSSGGTTAVSTSVSTSLALSESFLGNGNVGGTSSVSYTVSANKTGPVDGAETITATYTRPEIENPALSNNAVQTLTYTYLLHAAPSFDATSNLMTLTLDFGDVALNTTSLLDFSIFNRGLATDQVGLDFSIDDILESGNTAAFTTDLESFSGLQAGRGNAYKARFAATTLGATEAIYRLTFGDDATVGLAANRYSYNLDLRLVGRVVGEPPVNGVPEPGVLALLGIGLLGFGLQRKRS